MRILASMFALLVIACVSANAAMMSVVISNSGSVQNNDAVAWSGYVFELNGGSTFDVGAVASPFALDTNLSDSDTLVFNGSTVNVGDYVNFSFDVIVPVTDGKISYSGFESYAIAVPEPATLALLGLGAFGVIKRRIG